MLSHTDTGTIVFFCDFFYLLVLIQKCFCLATVETEFVMDDDTPSKYYLHVSIAVIAAGAFLVFCFVCAALIKNQTNR